MPPAVLANTDPLAVAGTDSTTFALIVAAIILFCCILFAIAYFRQRKKIDLDGELSGLSPYEKWMHIEEKKQRGIAPTLANPRRSVFDEGGKDMRRLNKLHTKHGIELDKKTIVNPMVRPKRASQTEIEHLYGGSDEVCSGGAMVENGFHYDDAEIHLAPYTVNPMLPKKEEPEDIGGLEDHYEEEEEDIDFAVEDFEEEFEESEEEEVVEVEEEVAPEPEVKERESPPAVNTNFVPPAPPPPPAKAPKETDFSPRQPPPPEKPRPPSPPAFNEHRPGGDPKEYERPNWRDNHTGKVEPIAKPKRNPPGTTVEVELKQSAAAEYNLYKPTLLRLDRDKRKTFIENREKEQAARAAQAVEGAPGGSGARGGNKRREAFRSTDTQS